MNQASSSNIKCPCNSNLNYQACCKPIHTDLANAETPEALMRARFSAHALKLPRFIIQSHYPASPTFEDDTKIWMRNLSAYLSENQFSDLVVHASNHNERAGYVNFEATINDGSHPYKLIEQSFFLKNNGTWYYFNGKIVTSTKQYPPTPAIDAMPKLAYIGDKILRTKTTSVTDFGNETQTLIDKLICAMTAFNGVGIAAPQIHSNARVFLTCVPEDESSEETLDGLKVCINPEILDASTQSETADEGCLSIPGVYAPVKRSTKIKVKYYDRTGSEVQETLKGFAAVVFQHELDHLNGVLFIDHLKNHQKRTVAKKLANLQSRVKRLRSMSS